MRKIIIITGANRGLGEAIFNNYFTENDTNVIISISRRCNEQQINLVNDKNSRFIFFESDFEKPKELNLDDLVTYLKEEESEISLFLNAATVGPIKKFENLNYDEIVNSIQINIVGSIILLQKVLSIIGNQRLDVINISSGAASKPLAGWSLYNSSKSYLKSIIETLQLEHSSNGNFRFFNFDPGVMNTQMQAEIRNANVNDFYRLQDFIDFQRNEKLKEPAFVVKELREKLSV